VELWVLVGSLARLKLPSLPTFNSVGGLDYRPLLYGLERLPQHEVTTKIRWTDNITYGDVSPPRREIEGTYNLAFQTRMLY